MIVELAAEADRDLEKIGDWIARYNPQRAESFVGELLAACLGLAEFPDRFPLVRRYERHGIRHRVHGNYLIFYRVEAEKVVVLHVLHDAIDYSGLLFLE
jgi:plasmid stabilization system protein ParE